MDYTLLKYKDKYTLKNNSTIETLSLAMYYKTCDTTSLYIEREILPGIEIEIKFNVDGIFSIVLNDGTIEETLPDILFYQNTLKRFIALTQKVVCGCKPCSECEDCQDDACEEILQAITLGLLFKSFNSPIYTTLFERIEEETKCLIEGCALNAVNHSIIDGKIKLKDTQKYLIGLYYLAFYYQDILTATDQEEADYIKTKYRFLVISGCLKKLGMVVSGETVLLEEPNVTVSYYMTDNYALTSATINLLTASADVISEVPFLQYEQGFVTPLPEVSGKLVFIVKETVVQNYNIYDEMGNNVTESFESTYYPTEEAKVFVSKSAFAVGTFYFKFKKLIYNG